MQNHIYGFILLNINAMAANVEKRLINCVKNFDGYCLSPESNGELHAYIPTSVTRLPAHSRASQRNRSSHGFRLSSSNSSR